MCIRDRSGTRCQVVPSVEVHAAPAGLASVASPLSIAAQRAVVSSPTATSRSPQRAIALTCVSPLAGSEPPAVHVTPSTEWRTTGAFLLSMADAIATNLPSGAVATAVLLAGLTCRRGASACLLYT